MKFANALLRRPVLASSGAVLTALAGMVGVLPVIAAFGGCALLSGAGIAFSLGSRRSDQFRAAERARALFLSTLGHEIRTPLNGVLGMTGLLLDTNLTPEQRTYVLAAYDSGEALSLLLEDLLALSDSAGGAGLDIKCRMTDVVKLVEGIAEIMAPRAWGKGLELATFVEPGVYGSAELDAGRVRQILMNLVSNGLQNTSSGGVLLSLKQTSGDDPVHDRLIFEVRDTGSGYSTAILNQSFDILVKSDDRMALGLAASQRIANSMTGSIGLKNTTNGGRAQLILPVPSRRRDRLPQGRWPSSFIVSPSKIIRHALKHQLATLGRPAESVPAIEDAIQKIPQMHADGNTIHHVFLDAAGMSPTGMTSSLDRLIRCVEAPLSCVLLLTPSERSDLGWVRDAGFDSYLMKPVRLRALRRRLEAVGPSEAGEKDTRDSSKLEFGFAVEPKKILLAEDNDINAALATALLTRSGHRVIRATDGNKAVKEALTGEFDLILMDLNMPVLSGFEAAKEITSVLGVKAPRIIAFSANSYDIDIRRCRESGMAGHLTKPIDLEAFHAMLVDTAAHTKKPQAA